LTEACGFRHELIDEGSGGRQADHGS
jgi:hypothetical protein